MFAEGEHDFFMKIADAQVTFESSDQGPAKVAVWHQAGQDRRGGHHRVIYHFRSNQSPQPTVGGPMPRFTL